MSLLRELLLTDENKFRTAYGAIKKTRMYRGRHFDDAMIDELTKEASNKQWSVPDSYKPRLQADDVPKIEIPLYPDAGQELFKNEVDIAKFYIFKVEEAKRRNIEFSLTFSDLKRILSRKTCYYTGIKFENIHESRTKLSLDRIDSDKGYTKENTVSCCYFINQLKNELFERPEGKFRMTEKQLSNFLSKLK